MWPLHPLSAGVGGYGDGARRCCRRRFNQRCEPGGARPAAAAADKPAYLYNSYGAQPRRGGTVKKKTLLTGCPSHTPGLRLF